MDAAAQEAVHHLQRAARRFTTSLSPGGRAYITSVIITLLLTMAVLVLPRSQLSFLALPAGQGRQDDPLLRFIEAQNKQADSQAGRLSRDISTGQSSEIIDPSHPIAGIIEGHSESNDRDIAISSDTGGRDDSRNSDGNASSNSDSASNSAGGTASSSGRGPSGLPSGSAEIGLEGTAGAEAVAAGEQAPPALAGRNDSATAPANGSALFSATSRYNSATAGAPSPLQALDVDPASAASTVVSPAISTDGSAPSAATFGSAPPPAAAPASLAAAPPAAPAPAPAAPTPAPHLAPAPAPATAAPSAPTFAATAPATPPATAASPSPPTTSAATPPAGDASPSSHPPLAEPPLPGVVGLPGLPGPSAAADEGAPSPRQVTQVAAVPPEEAATSAAATAVFEDACERELVEEVRSVNWTARSSPAIGSMAYSPEPPIKGDSYTLLFPNGLSSNLPLGSNHSHKWTTVVNTPSCFRVKVRSAGGGLFDDRCRQRAFFQGLLLLLPSQHRSDMFFRKRLIKNPATMNVTVPLQLHYDHTLSEHKVCFQVPFPGTFQLSLFLVFTNAYRLIYEINPRNNDGFAHYKPVMRQNVEATAPLDFSLTRHRSTLPICTFDAITSSSNYGFWMDFEWFPFACQLSRMSHDEVFSCLDGKRVLLLGDSQLRYTLPIWLSYLKAGSRDVFMSDIRAHPKAYDPFKHMERPVNNSDPPTERATGLPPLVKWGNRKSPFYFHGVIRNGFTHISLQRRMSIESTGEVESTTGSNTSKPASSLSSSSIRLSSFNLSFCSFSHVGHPIFHPWMLNPNMTRGSIVFDGKPFDHVLLASFLHDIPTERSPADYRRALGKGILHRLSSIVRHPSDVTFFGPWSALESIKPGMFKHQSNNVRGFAFADALDRYLQAMKYGRLVSLRHLTTSHPDLCIDSTHYAQPVSLAMLDVWLSGFCSINE